VEQYLRIYGNEEQNDWADLLLLAQFTHNTWPNESTGQTPCNLLIGHTPTLVIAEKDTTIPEITWWKEWLEQNRLRAQAALRNAQRMLVQMTNQKKGERHYKGFEKGDQVWLEGMNLRLSHPKAKLAPKRYGSFRVINIISPVVYRLELPTHWKIHNIFHSSLLTPYHETPENGENFTQPPPELIEGEEEYVVDRIMNS
jgi:hypothetical protein